LPQQPAPAEQQALLSAQQSLAAEAGLDWALEKPVAARAARARTVRTIREFFMI
jgi:hypothetical protein